MKYTLRIVEGREEEIIVYAHAESELTDRIKRLILESDRDECRIIGYTDEDIMEIAPSDVHCFFIEDKKLYASLDGKNVLVKKRLYEIEEMLGDNFIKINQSSLANPKKIERFSVSLGATLNVHFKNGRRDYVSRRQVKHVKERMGIK